MARVEIPFVVQKPSAVVSGGVAPLAVSGASVQVNLRVGGAATVFAAETGGTTLPNPLTTTATGAIDGWLDEGSYTLVISGAGISTYNQQFEATRGDGVGKYAAGSIPVAAFSSAASPFLVPTGTILAYAGGSAPTGYFLADGSAKSRTTEAALFAVCGTAYGAGDGSTTFNLPDLRGRVAVGQSASAHADVQVRGNSDAIAVGSRRLGHTHTVAAHAHSVPAHFHGKGTLSVSAGGGSHSHSDTGHSHSQAGHAHASSNSGFLFAASDQGAGGQFYQNSGSSLGVLWNAFTNVIAPAINNGNANIAASTHSHPSSEFSGSVGSTGSGNNGDSGFNTATATPATDAQSGAYLAVPYIIKN